MERYPAFTTADWIATFGMAVDNVIRRDVAYDDLGRNFNYRKYLQAKGWPRTPSARPTPWRACGGDCPATA